MRLPDGFARKSLELDFIDKALELGQANLDESKVLLDQEEALPWWRLAARLGLRIRIARLNKRHQKIMARIDITRAGQSWHPRYMTLEGL